jgi:hypothetical protein
LSPGFMSGRAGGIDQGLEELKRIGVHRLAILVSRSAGSQ